MGYIIPLNKRERTLYKSLKQRILTEGQIRMDMDEEYDKYSSLLDKLKESGYVTIIFADNCAFVGKGFSNFEQYEIEEKEARKEERKASAHDYKVAIISAIVGAVIGAALTFVITYFSML